MNIKFTTLLLWILLFGSTSAQQVGSVEWAALNAAVDQQVENMRYRLPDLRRSFYRYPELPGSPLRTTNIMNDTFKRFGFRVERVGYSIVGTLSGGLPGPAVAIRFEMDAVRIQNPVQLPHLMTRVQGVRHALGNDVQLALASSLARVFGAIKSQIPGTVRLIVESGSTRLSGAAPLIERDVLVHQPELEIVIGLRLAPLPSGQLAIHTGQATAAGGLFEVELKQMAEEEFEKRLQELASNLGLGPSWNEAEFFAQHAQSPTPLEDLFLVRWTNDSAHSLNPIFRGQFMTTDVGGLRALREAFRKALEPMSEAVILRFPVEEVPPIENDSDLAQTALGYLREAFGEDRVLELKNPNPFVADDLSLFQEEAKVVLLWLGVANKERGITAIPRDAAFNLDERALVRGLAAMAKLPLRYMTERVNSVARRAGAAQKPR